MHKLLNTSSLTVRPFILCSDRAVTVAPSPLCPKGNSVCSLFDLWPFSVVGSLRVCFHPKLYFTQLFPFSPVVLLFYLWDSIKFFCNAKHWQEIISNFWVIYSFRLGPSPVFHMLVLVCPPFAYLFTYCCSVFAQSPYHLFPPCLCLPEKAFSRLSTYFDVLWVNSSWFPSHTT